MTPLTPQQREIVEKVRTLTAERDAALAELAEVKHHVSTLDKVVTAHETANSLATMTVHAVSAERDAARAECAAMRPVVEAAERFKDDGRYGDGTLAGLVVAVNAYRRSE